ncbi:MAG: chemotaxis protein CheA [Clostridiales bacterium]|nr:chemotaxis protein CheA [Clostridiales bacterium]
MSDQYTNEPMLDLFIFETSQQIELLEQYIITCEKENGFKPDIINDIFRIMHTLKGSAAMMMFQNISALAHTIEDVFYFLREDKPELIDCSALSDLVLEGIDFIKVEIEKIKSSDQSDGDASSLIETLKEFLIKIKNENSSVSFLDNKKQRIDKKSQSVHDGQQYYIRKKNVIKKIYKYMYKALVFFEDGCEMENIRAFTIIHNLREITDEVYYLPEDIMDHDDSAEYIKQNGFQIFLKTDYTYEKMYEFFKETIFLKDLELVQIENEDEFERFIINHKEEIDSKLIQVPDLRENAKIDNQNTEHQHISNVQSMISVSVAKLDKLMDLVGEMVIAEAMVIQNPDLAGLELDNFQKAARQLNKITSEIQDMVMSIRMVPLTTTFHKMNRIVRDMSKKLNKEVDLKIIGEETEVDKNIIEHISDPLIHLVRNSIDHGIESPAERLSKGKPSCGTVTLEAKSAGSDVLIIIKDDGKGLDRNRIIKKAQENNLLYRDVSEMSDKEIFNMILLPGFSTKEDISEFSGRGVGMDVVAKNIEEIGGSVSVDSYFDKGTVITLKIPLTLAIIDGMNIKVGDSCFTIPTTSIKASYRPQEKDLITDPSGNEMIMVREKCCPILRLHKKYKVSTNITKFNEGILIMVEQDGKSLCVFADELIGQQQVVVKALPEYIKRLKKIDGLAGCTLLGDGSISLILDVAGL